MRKVTVLVILSFSLASLAHAEKSSSSDAKTLCGVPSASGYSLRSNSDLLKKLKVKRVTDELSKSAINFIVPANKNEIHVSRYHLVFKEPRPFTAPIRTDWWGCAEGLVLAPAKVGYSEQYGIFQLTDAFKYNQSNGEAGME